ncbi:hypothetical protein D0Z06_03485 [Geodermatophilus marinus]|nr:hypothetical protein D0Z06_03485 [Geodermatophilus sp. LHW52908]
MTGRGAGRATASGVRSPGRCPTGTLAVLGDRGARSGRGGPDDHRPAPRGRGVPAARPPGGRRRRGPRGRCRPHDARTVRCGGARPAAPAARGR